MTRRKVVIDRDRCNGCGLCVNACHEGAIGMVEGKAALVSENLCDGIGDCLPACPMDAISFTDESPMLGRGLMAAPQLQGPIQIGLVSPAPQFGDMLLVASDCSAFVVDDYKRRFVRNRPVIIGCPKLDDRERFDKILQILRNTSVTEVEVIRMEVPCCKPLVNMTLKAADECGRAVTVRETVISRDGRLIQPATVVN